MTATHSIPVADPAERDRAFRRARWNSAFVRMMRLVLPVLAVVMLSSYGLFVQRKIEIETKEQAGRLETGKLLRSISNLSMESPSYEGFNKKDGSRFRVSAKRAITDLSDKRPVELFGIAGEFEQPSGGLMRVAAQEGLFDQKSGLLKLDRGIDVAAPDGLSVQLTSATIDTKHSRIVSKQPVRITMPAGEVHGNRMVLKQSSREFVFTDGVAARFKPNSTPQKRPAAPAKKRAMPMAFGTQSQAPVTVTAKTLTVFDMDKTARFETSVRAEQEGRSLEAPMLNVKYSGDVGTAAATSAGGGRLQKILADGGVVLRDSDHKITSRSAAFDAVRETARLEGGVNITSSQGRRISSQSAELDVKANRAVLMGRVVAAEKSNLMRGHRLVYEQGSGRLRLTAPARSAGSDGRIFVRFEPPARTKRRTASRGAALPSAMAFRTNPNAPIEIRAVSLDVQDRRSSATFEGSIVATQGDFRIQTPKMTATYGGSLGLFRNTGSPAGGGQVQLRKIRATDPVQVTSGNGVKARGQRALFDVAANTVTINGNVILEFGRQVIRGEQLVIDLKTGLSRIKRTASQPSRGDKAAPPYRPMEHGNPPSITNSPKQRDCGGRPCAVFFIQDLKKQRLKRKKVPARRPGNSSSWSATTQTN